MKLRNLIIPSTETLELSIAFVITYLFAWLLIFPGSSE
jgi:hypothetical protein